MRKLRCLSSESEPMPRSPSWVSWYVWAGSGPAVSAAVVDMAGLTLKWKR